MSAPRWVWVGLGCVVLSWVVLAAAGCAMLPCCRLPLLGDGGEPAPASAKQWTEEIKGLAGAVDGDSLAIAGQRVNLWGIDAPEVRQQCTSPEGPVPCGVMAMDRLQGLVENAEVECQVRDRDREGRFVAVCTVPSADLSAALVRDGWAMAYRKYSTNYVDEEDSARMDRRGMWAYEFVAPEDWRSKQ